MTGMQQNWDNCGHGCRVGMNDRLKVEAEPERYPEPAVRAGGWEWT